MLLGKARRTGLVKLQGESPSWNPQNSEIENVQALYKRAALEIADNEYNNESSMASGAASGVFVCNGRRYFVNVRIASIRDMDKF